MVIVLKTQILDFDMANHAFVKSRRYMHPSEITQIITDVSHKHLMGNLQISEDHRWWEIKYVSPNATGTWAHLSCWLPTRRTFEIRHGRGDFCWWIDFLITNEVALFYDGTISDEGVEETWKGKPGKYDSIEEHKKVMQLGMPPRHPALEAIIYPPEFR